MPDKIPTRVIELEVTIRTTFHCSPHDNLTTKELYERLTYPDLIRIVNHRIVKEEFKVD